MRFLRSESYSKYQVSHKEQRKNTKHARTQPQYINNDAKENGSETMLLMCPLVALEEVEENTFAEGAYKKEKHGS